MDCSRSGLSDPHHLPKFAQVHVHCISDAIQPLHPLMPSSPSTLHLSQHQGLFPVSQLFTSDDQNTGVSASASALPMSIQGWFLLRLTGLTPLLSKGLSSLLQPQFKGINSSVLSLLYGSTRTSIHDYWKAIALTIQTFVSKVISVLLNTLSRFVIAFLPRSKSLWISWLQSPFPVILELKKICYCFHFSPIYFPSIIYSSLNAV